MDRLYQACPGRNVPRKPEDPWYGDLEYYDVAWYRHTDNEWYPARVTGPAPPPDANSQYAGHRVWHGITRGLDSNNLGKEEPVYLCPTLGNAKPDNSYMRLLLQVHGKIPARNDFVELLVTTFKVVAEVPCNPPDMTTIDPRLLTKI